MNEYLGPQRLLCLSLGKKYILWSGKHGKGLTVLRMNCTSTLKVLRDMAGP